MLFRPPLHIDYSARAQDLIALERENRQAACRIVPRSRVPPGGDTDGVAGGADGGVWRPCLSDARPLARTGEWAFPAKISRIVLAFPPARSVGVASPSHRLTSRLVSSFIVWLAQRRERRQTGRWETRQFRGKSSPRIPDDPDRCDLGAEGPPYTDRRGRVYVLYQI